MLVEQTFKRTPIAGRPMLPNGDLAPWLRYEDRELPQSGMLTVQEEVKESTGDPNAAGWRSDQWQVNCALVPADQAEKALGADFDSRYCFSSGWDENGSFDFAGHRCRPFYMEAFVFQRRHPLHRNTVVELCHDFVWYHMLDRPSPEVYFHPGENVEVARIAFPDHPDAWATVTVHLDFLRDFLATCHRALLLWFVADRFATFDGVGQIALNAPSACSGQPQGHHLRAVFEVTLTTSLRGQALLIVALEHRAFRVSLCSNDLCAFGQPPSPPIA